MSEVPFIDCSQATSNLAGDHQLLEDIIERAASLLPAQGPITAFAFLNPLQGLEEIPFDLAMRRVKSLYGCEPYLSEERYRNKIQRGRIQVETLRREIETDLGQRSSQRIAGLVPASEFRLQLVLHTLYSGSDRELDWLLAETNALKKFRSEVKPELRHQMLQSACDNPPTQVLSEADYLERLWQVVFTSVQATPEPVSSSLPPVRIRDLILAAWQVDSDRLVHELLARFTAAFLDQGHASWALPDRELGFFAAFSTYVAQKGILQRRWMRGLADEFDRIKTTSISPLESIQQSLDALGITRLQWADGIAASLLALRGYAGMVWQTEARPDRVSRPSPSGTLIEFIAVRLILDRFAAAYLVSERAKMDNQVSQLRSAPNDLDKARKWLLAKWSPECELTKEQLAFVIFQLAQVMGWPLDTVSCWQASDWNAVVAEVRMFSEHERRRVLHNAYEQDLINRSLGAIRARVSEPPSKPNKPQLQVVCCIDAREESFRRHLEELSSDVETFGTAGFFGLPIHYRGLADAQFSSLAPIVLRPKHWITEEAVFTFEEVNASRAKARKVIGATTHKLRSGSLGSLGGAIVTTLLGPLATAPLISRVLFPRLTGAMHRTAKQFVAPPAVTRLHIERDPGHPPSEHESGWGLTIAEMAECAQRVLRDIGLTKDFAPLVILMGHGSCCLNNPHESAYHCGACAGNSGGPNARALAAMFNERRVRRHLEQQGISIPEETYFVGAEHNTATEEIAFFDLELVPAGSIRHLRDARQLFRQVAQRNAHERCRRFESAPLDISPDAALLHVQHRTEDLAQTRPEYGNGTNALCFVGRRSRLRGLFLDRRSFLMSYDPEQDDSEGSILARILSAVVPVCEGINTLYSFSAIDPIGFGSGTKLPHNVTSLLGVMDGAASDLRTGLPWQGVDIHEPVRLLFVIECKPDVMQQIIHANPVIRRICGNRWSHLTVLDPNSDATWYFDGHSFNPYTEVKTNLPRAHSSYSWYQGKRDHLEFALIEEPRP